MHGTGEYALRLRAVRTGGWQVAGRDLDPWLRRRGAPGLAGRIPVLAYGSNACPSKVTWLRTELGLAGPAVVLRCRTVGAAAVWSASRRRRDGQVPAVLAAMPGHVETHAVWLADPAQVRVLDICEGRGERYELVHLEAPGVLVSTEDGTVLDRPLAYVTCGPERAPMLRDGSHVPIGEVGQAQAQRLVDAGTPAGPHDDACGLTVTPSSV